MAKMRMNELRSILARANAIVEEYDTNRAAELAAAGDDSGRLETKDQPKAQDAAHEPAVTRAYRTLESIKGYDRLRKNGQSLPPTQIGQEHFFKPTK